MKVEILNLYSNVALPNSGLIGDHGQSFLIKTEKQQILLDVGTKGKILLHNMKKLGINPNDISLLIFSHGHYDHTGALPMLLDARTTDEPLKILAHPDAKLPRKMKIGFIKKKSINIPELTEAQQAKVNFEFDKAPRKITDFIRTSGEITDRPYRQGLEKELLREVNGKLEVDKVTEDLSVIIETKEGQVVITGCAHAGILNICKQAKETSKKPIKAILGGTHMVRYTEKEVLETAEKFVKEFDDPDLYLNHCTDKLPVKLLKQTKTIDILREKYGEEKIKNCYVGTKLIFEV
ncbi:MAG: MBL fold metallo-hydrolase [Candidatus Heimdallarchaeota archaeon]